MKGKIIYYHYIDAEFGNKFIVDDVVCTSEEKLEERMNEIKSDLKKNYYATVKFISFKEVEII